MATLALPIRNTLKLRDAMLRGLGFARARVDMKVGERFLTLRDYHPQRLKRMVPAHAWKPSAAYGIRPEPAETHDDFARGEQ